jgi:murein DD-endopeptidase MepM/ murein hydrolase activator NlpD
VPPSSSAGASESGYVWPSGARIITQYYGLRHHALDIAGAWQTPNYATKAGKVITSQCGWNSGYGCYIIIDHGGGVKSLYGHNSKLLVSVGDEVEAGQTIGLMGNTGKVRGLTGIHLHFEIIVNGARVNPLRYTR